MSHTSNFIRVNGINLHYHHWDGNGPPILVLHGNSHCGGVYEPLAEVLSQRFEVITVDLRGHGLSDKPGSYTWSDLRADVVGLVDALDLKDILIAAHSRGGGVGLLTAAARPDRVTGVITYEPNVATRYARRPSRPDDAPPRPPQIDRERRSTFPSRDAMYKHYRNRGAFKDWREDYFRAYIEHGGIERPDGTIELANPPSVQAQMVSVMQDLTEWHSIHECPVPVRAIYGDISGWMVEGQDPTTPIKELFSTVDMLVMPNATHSGPMEHPEFFEKAILNFEAEVRGSRAD